MKFIERWLKLGMLCSHLSKELFHQFFIFQSFVRFKEGHEYQYDGQNLVNLLAQYQTPPIGKDKDQQKFEKIQEFVRRLLHLPNAILEFPRDEPASAVSVPPLTLTIKNDGLRLPITYYGTGVHELIIMITAVLSKENAICCIEEPNSFASTTTTGTYRTISRRDI